MRIPGHNANRDRSIPGIGCLAPISAVIYHLGRWPAQGLLTLDGWYPAAEIACGLLVMQFACALWARDQ